jgi:hypothetical protein
MCNIDASRPDVFQSMPHFSTAVFQESEAAPALRSDEQRAHCIRNFHFLKAQHPET